MKFWIEKILSYLKIYKRENCGKEEKSAVIAVAFLTFVGCIGYFHDWCIGSIEYYDLASHNNEMTVRVYPGGKTVDPSPQYGVAITWILLIIMYAYHLLPERSKNEKSSKEDPRIIRAKTGLKTQYTYGTICVTVILAIVSFIFMITFLGLAAYAKLPLQQKQVINTKILGRSTCRFEATRKEGKVVEFLVKVVNPGNSPNKEVYLTTQIGKELRKDWFIANAKVFSGKGKNRKKLETKQWGYSGPIAAQESSAKGEYKFYYRDPKLKAGDEHYVELYIHPRIKDFKTFETAPDVNITDLDNLFRNKERIPLHLSLTPQ